MNERINKFNKKWKGKQVYACKYVGSTLNFNPEEFTFCCSSTTGNYPVVYEVNEENYKLFTKENYIDAMMRVFEDNQKRRGACCGCELLEQVPFEEWNVDQVKITNIVWNHFRGCNSRCVYCGDRNKFKKYYEAIEVFDELEAEDLIGKETAISFGGGEPTLLDNLNEYIELGLKHNWPQILNTSGLLYKDYIEKALTENDNFSVQISVDSGTAETYRKVKGQNGFSIVWNTIRNYCRSGTRVFVKYIMFSYNSSHKEIDAFIEQCNSAGVANISVSAEAASNWAWETEVPWEYGETEMVATSYLMGKILENEKALFLYQGNIAKKNFDHILDLYVSNYLKDWIDGRKVCIWGMGACGNEMLDILEGRKIQVEWVGDNAVNKHGKSFHNIQCFSLDQLVVQAKKETSVCILLAISHYEQIYSDLMRNLPNAEIRVINVL